MPHIAYSVDGEVWPSATALTALLPQDWLWAWYKDRVKKYGWRGWQWCKAYSNRAMRLGTHTHSLVEATLKGEPEPRCWLLPYNETINVAEPERRMKEVRKWAKALVSTTVKDEIKEIEKKTINKKLHEHGTIDAIAIENDAQSYFVKDWKTSSSVSSDYAIQLAIYQRCLEYEGYRMADYGEIERVDKKLKSKKAQETGEPHVQVKRFERLSQYYPVIDALHVVYNYVNGLGDYAKPINDGVGTKISKSRVVINPSSPQK